MTKAVLLSGNQLLTQKEIIHTPGSLLRRETKENDKSNPFAKPSKSMKNTNIEIIGDNDVWEERILVQKNTGKEKSFFYSANTGFRVKDEPPTGASQVIYLNT